jgi:hypothetical protein
MSVPNGVELYATPTGRDAMYGTADGAYCAGILKTEIKTTYLEPTVLLSAANPAFSSSLMCATFFFQFPLQTGLKPKFNRILRTTRRPKMC